MAGGVVSAMDTDEIVSDCVELVEEDNAIENKKTQKPAKMGKKRRAQENKEVDTKTPKTQKTSPLQQGGGKKMTQPLQSQINKALKTPLPEDKAPTILNYIKTDTGPYKAIVSLKQSYMNSDTGKPPMDIEVSRALINMGVNFSLLERISRFKWMLTFNNKDAANNAVQNRYVLESKYNIQVPWYLVFRKIIIKGIPVDVSSEEIWKELTDSNPTIVFDKEDIFRLRSRVYVDGIATFQDSTSVRLNIRSSSIPSHVYMWRSRVNITPYIPGIRQCFNCGQLTHATKFCKNNAKCLTCGMDKHVDGSSCSGKMECVNCGGKHQSLSRECPEVITKKKTTELMATENLDFNTAKRIVMQGSSYTSSQSDRRFTTAFPRQMDRSEFPPLRKLHAGKDGGMQPIVPGTNIRGHQTPSNNLENFADAVINGKSTNTNLPTININLPQEIIDKLDKIIAFFDNIAIARVVESPPPSQALDEGGGDSENQDENEIIQVPNTSNSNVISKFICAS